MIKPCVKTTFLYLLLMSLTVQADISGNVFKDSDADGVADSAEIGVSGVVITAYDDLGALVAQTASCGQFAVAIAADPPTIPAAINVPACAVANFGDYTLTALTASTDYRLEASFTDSMIFSTANGVDSVRFETDGATGVLFGVNYPEDYCQNNPRIVAGCYPFNGASISPYDPANTEPLVVSWPYDTRFTSATPGQVHSGSYNTDADYGDVGSIFAVAVHRPTSEVFFGAVASPIWPSGTGGHGGIYSADYSGAGDAFVPGSATLFVDLDPLVDLTNQFPIDAGDTDRFGEQGLGGLAVSEDGLNMWAINMGGRSLLKMEIGNPAVAPVAGDITEIPITDDGCVDGLFRPSAITLHRGSVYVGGICDASVSSLINDLHAVVLEYDGTAFTRRMDEVLDFNVNQIFPQNSFQMSPWSNTNSATAPQPVMTNLVFDDDEALVIGLMPRDMYNVLLQTAGYMLRAHSDGLGGFIMENAGISGPYTTSAETNWNGAVEFTDANGSNPEPLNEGPGSAYFYENGISYGPFAPPPQAAGVARYHSTLFSAGITVIPGTGEVAAGFTDPLSIDSFGVRYLDRTTGESIAGLQFGGLKIAFVSDVDAICRSAPLEVGNRLWCDADQDGVQDPGEAGANGVAVSFQCGIGNAVTVNTAGDGNYVFTDVLYAAANAGAQIPRGASCAISIPITGTNATAINNACEGVGLSPQNMGGADDNSDLRDSDGALNVAGTAVEIPVTTGGSGNNTHAIDQGFFGTDIDFGDNPDPSYATLLANNGPSHIISPGLFLGACVDTEVDGQPNADATGDDGAVGLSTLGTCATAGDDEDGVSDLQNLFVGNGTASLDVASTGACLLDGWIDFNQNGSFGDAGEQVFTSQPLVNGANDDLNFAIPATAIAGDTFSRFRCSSAGGLAPTGAAADGEVEDYPVIILPDLMLGDFVWYDTNQNGQQDIGEPGVNGITVNLYNNATCAAPIFDTTTTVNGGLPAVDGFYQFSQLIAGSYCVEFTNLPTDYEFTDQNAGNDATDSDANTGTGQVQNINLAADDSTIDAGVFLDGSISGLTWCESTTNANTTYNPGDGDTVLTNIGITLYQDANCNNTVDVIDAGTAVNQDTTNPGGTYLFPDLPVGPSGAALCYITQVNTADVDLGTCDSGITPSPLGPDLDVDTPNSTDNDFGFEEDLSLGDFVWFDTNQNGQQDGGEPGVNGITVNLYDNATCTGQATDATSTANGGTPAADGFYQFTGLSANDYCVEFTDLPVNYGFTDQNVGNDTTDSDADIGTGQVQNINLVADDPTIDAGVILNGSIAGLTWCESSTNTNTAYNPGDGDTVLTDVGITLYTDANCNNSVDGTEGTTAVNLDTANPTGTYLFNNLPVGPVGSAVCYVVEVDDADTDLGTCDTGITPVTQSPDLDTAVPDVTDVNFGFDDNLGLGDFVWFDTNQNGEQNSFEPGVNGITVNLYDNATCAAPSVSSTITANGGSSASDGYYFFGDLDPGSYCVEFTDLPTDYEFTQQFNSVEITDSDVDPVNGQAQNINLTEVNPNIDAGLILNGSITGLTWCESSTNSNTSFDVGDGDTVLTDITVTLYEDADCSDTVNGTEAGSAVTQSTTNPGGSYLFDDLPVGPSGSAACYVVEVDVNDADLDACDSGLTPVTQDSELDVDTPDVTDVNFGFDDNLGLGDYVWYDNNQNGQQDAGEPGFNGITVNLYDNATCIAPAVDTTTTANGGTPANDGYYFFGDLDLDDYCVEFIGLPVGYVFTDQNTGDDATDSDANPVNGQVLNINLTATDRTVDVGIYASNGQVSGLLYCDDSPENGMQDAGEEVTGVTMTLSRDYDCDDNGDEIIGTTSTDGAGSFLFDNLPIGLASAPPNPQACYVLEYDTNDPLLADCDESVTPETQVITIDTVDPEAPPVTFIVINGVELPPRQVPVNSWLMLILMTSGVMFLFWLHRRRSV